MNDILIQRSDARISAKIPKILLADTKKAAKKAGLNLSQYLKTALKRCTVEDLKKD